MWLTEYKVTPQPIRSHSCLHVFTLYALNVNYTWLLQVLIGLLPRQALLYDMIDGESKRHLSQFGAKQTPMLTACRCFMVRTTSDKIQLLFKDFSRTNHGFDTLLAKTFRGLILIRFLLLLPWLITLLYPTSRCTFHNNSLPKGNSHSVWFEVCCIWGIEIEFAIKKQKQNIVHAQKTFQVNLQVLRPRMSQIFLGKVILFQRKYVV